MNYGFSLSTFALSEWHYHALEVCTKDSLTYIFAVERNSADPLAEQLKYESTVSVSTRQIKKSKQMLESEQLNYELSPTSRVLKSSFEVGEVILKSYKNPYVD